MNERKCVFCNEKSNDWVHDSCWGCFKGWMLDARIKAENDETLS